MFSQIFLVTKIQVPHGAVIRVTAQSEGLGSNLSLDSQHAARQFILSFGMVHKWIPEETW